MRCDFLEYICKQIIKRHLHLRAIDSPPKDMDIYYTLRSRSDRACTRRHESWTSDPESWKLLRYRGRVICREASGLAVRRYQRDLNGISSTAGGKYRSVLFDRCARFANIPCLSYRANGNGIYSAATRLSHSDNAVGHTFSLPLYYKIVLLPLNIGRQSTRCHHSEMNFPTIVSAVLCATIVWVLMITLFAEYIARDCIIKVKNIV